MSAAEKIMICVENHIDDSGTVITAPGEVSTLQASRLQNYQISTLFRTTDDTKTKTAWEYKFDIQKPCRLAGLLNHNASITAKQRVLFSNEDRTVVMTNATYTAGVVTISATAHGLSVNDWVGWSGVVGMTDINGQLLQVTSVVDADTFTVALVTSQTYTNGGTVSVRTIVEDSGLIDIYPEIENFGDRPWGVFNWGGKIGQRELQGLTPYAFYIAAASVMAKFVNTVVEDENNTKGYHQTGRGLVYEVYQPTENMEYEWNIRFIDKSRSDDVDGGQEWFDKKPKKRMLEFILKGQSEDEVYTNSFIFDRILGTTGDLLIIPRPDSTRHLMKQAIYGRLDSMTDIRHSNDDKAFQKSYFIKGFI